MSRERKKLLEKIEEFRFIPITDELYQIYDSFAELIEKEEGVQQREDRLLLAFYRGETEFRLGKYDKALERLSDCLLYQSETTNASVMANVYNILGLIYSTIGYQLLALEQYLRGREYAIKAQDYRKKAIIQGNIGWLYRDIGNYDKALEYYLSSYEDLKYIQEDHGYSMEILILSYIGQIYFKMAQYEDGIKIVHYLEKRCLEEKDIYYSGVTHSLYILGYTYLQEEKKCLENMDLMIESAKNKEDFLEFSEFYFDCCRFIIEHNQEKAREFLDVLTANCEYFGIPYVLMKLKRHEVLYARKYETHQRYLECVGIYFEYEMLYEDNSKRSASSSMEMIEKLEKTQRERAQYLEESKRDLMTGLFNKVTFENTVAMLLEKKNFNLSNCALAVIDIDNFKQINDSLGHICGDQVILEVVRYMREVFGDTAVLGRIGGDEFGIFWAEVDNKKLIYSLLDDMMESVKCSPKGICPFSVSIGVAFTGEKMSYQQFFKSADDGLYEAKNNGKNTIKELV